MLRVFLILFITLYSVYGLKQSFEKCNSNELVVYKIVFATNWTRELFPKQFPEWRPPAQWSKLIGRSHDRTNTLFHVGSYSSKGFQSFAEMGRTEILEVENQDEDGVFDEFYAPPVTSGAGKSETDFFVDGNHSRVSVAARIVPSPDWFVGIDNLELCTGGNWIDTVIIEASPMDAGTDNGFTFTAPNWPSEPKERIFKITSKYPRHPANSFYYPELEDLPAIATFRLTKEKVYLRIDTDKESIATPDITDSKVVSSTTEGTLLVDKNTGKENEVSNDLPNYLYSFDIDAKRKSYKKHHRRNAGKKHSHSLHNSCKVTKWSKWSPCSVSCGVGSSSRTRTVISTRPGGRPCPALAESKWCESHTNCNHKLFQW